jgi:hypothetical protein
MRIHHLGDRGEEDGRFHGGGAARVCGNGAELER